MKFDNISNDELIDEIRRRNLAEEFYDISSASDSDIIEEVFDRRLTYEFEPRMSVYSTNDLIDELEYRGFNVEDGSATTQSDDVDKIVQSHRCGKLAISGENSELLTEFLYRISNKVV